MKTNKSIFIILFFACSLIGFMVRLPFIFHSCDKLLHSLFYFAAAIFINILYPKRWYVTSMGLTIFGIGIEFLQEYSNKLSLRISGKVVHGNFDIQDVKYNTIGLVIGTLCFFIFQWFFQIYDLKKAKN